MKNSRWLILLILVVVILNLNAQDSLVLFHELTFRSDFEREQLEAYNHSQSVDLAGLFLNLDFDMNEEASQQIRERVESLSKQLTTSGIQKKKPEKQIKVIYDQVHDTFLRQYEMENRFHEIFNTGKYNCVTATALYALVLQHLSIPYSIKEEPTHVYLVAYPNVKNILIETTTPMLGYINFDPKFKSSFVGNLKNQKLIGPTEAQSKSVDELFNKYYFQYVNIDLKQLVGIHYLNDAIFLRGQSDIISAFQQAEKAYLFYPSQRCQYILAVLCTEILTKEKLDPLERSVYIGKISRYSDQGITPEMIEGEFINLTQEILVKENNKPLYTKCFNTIVRSIQDSALVEKISYIYYYENGRIFFNQGNFESALPNFRGALKLQPNNVDLGGTFIRCLSETFRNQTSSKSVLDTLNQFSKEFPALLALNSFNSMIASAYIFLFGEAFDKASPIEGEEYRKHFENLLLSHKNLNLNYDLIGRAYSEA